MAEWSIAAVLKTVEGHTSGGSNPSLSAINAENQQIAKQTPSFTLKNVKLGVFYIFNAICAEFSTDPFSSHLWFSCICIQ